MALGGRGVSGRDAEARRGPTDDMRALVGGLEGSRSIWRLSLRTVDAWGGAEQCQPVGVGLVRKEAGPSGGPGRRVRRRGESESSTPPNTASSGRRRWATAGRPGRTRSRSTLAWPLHQCSRVGSPGSVEVPSTVSSPSTRYGSQASINTQHTFCSRISTVPDPTFKYWLSSISFKIGRAHV